VLYAGFLLGLFIDPEDGVEIFYRKVRLKSADISKEHVAFIFRIDE
jgi:hypothetical protein